MIKITVDTNILIDVEEKRFNYIDVLKLFELDNKKEISLYFPAVIAIEKWIEKKEVDNFNKFINYLKKLGINKPKTLSPLGYLDLFFLDNVTLFDEDGPEFELADKLKIVLFPEAEETYLKFCEKNNWDPNSEKTYLDYRNISIDALILWCHVYYKNDILLTRDSNFKKKLSQNDEFKQLKVMTPSEIIQFLQK
jgi:rRNA-processing protein FCF1